MAVGLLSFLKEREKRKAKASGFREEFERFAGIREAKDIAEQGRLARGVSALLEREDIPVIMRNAMITQLIPSKTKELTLVQKLKGLTSEAIAGRKELKRSKQLGLSEAFGVIRGEHFGGIAPRSDQEVKWIQTLRHLLEHGAPSKDNGNKQASILI